MKISPARTAAFDILLRIETEKAFSSVLLPQYGSSLSAQDRSLCHEIVLGVLRRKLRLDRTIDQLIKNSKLDIEVRVALRIGLFQLLFLDRVPEYSIVNESVNLVQRAKKTSAKGLVNAVLRRAQRGVPEIEFLDDIERLSVETSHPGFLIEKWIDQFGTEATADLAAANNRIPRTCFRFTSKGLLTRLEKKPRWSESRYLDGCFFVENFYPELIEMAERGEIYFQDEASQLIAASVTLGNGESFLDVCAAPGGKTGSVAARTASGGFIIAGDLHWQRVKFLKQNCETQGVDAIVVQYDGEHSLPFADETFDAVLVDAPCSGTGTIRHNPELRFGIKPSDFADLAVKQLSILNNASKLVKPGGRVYYSTCSLEVEENEMVIDAFLNSSAPFFVVTPERQGDLVTSGGFLRTFPGRGNMDGFFLAVLERK